MKLLLSAWNYSLILTAFADGRGFHAPLLMRAMFVRPTWVASMQWFFSEPTLQTVPGVRYFGATNADVSVDFLQVLPSFLL